ncbi:VOC family protein [Halosimplex aquaticum]|uniref:VOC family protein n=1 Tax=Halosimplex aquaticum TaxID=3026162 RepID=A0ABD5YAU0_9EURY|nr:VOC family protein [Halosimplex aquaticum]
MTTDHADPECAGQLHHVELCAADLDAAVDFWDWLLGELGYDRKDEWEGGLSWENGPTYVVLVQAEAADRPFDRREAGLNHLAFHAASREQVDDITAGIRERDDASLLYGEQHPYAGGYYALYCEGPESIKIEVVAPE